VPKSLGVMGILCTLDDEQTAAKEAIIDMDIINRV